jgi:hypothetical protein
MRYALVEIIFSLDLESFEGSVAKQGEGLIHIEK